MIFLQLHPQSTEEGNCEQIDAEIKNYQICESKSEGRGGGAKTKLDTSFNIFNIF